MDLSLFLARFWGIYFLIMAAIWIFRREQFEITLRQISFSDGLLAITGIIAIIAGLMIAIVHPIWELNWKGLITLIAYLAIFQGIMRIAFPNQVQSVATKMLDKGFIVSVLILVVLGGVLTYHGFFA
jgi:hypothetical protein